MAVLMAAGALTACSGSSSSQTTVAATEAERHWAAGSETANEFWEWRSVTIRLVHYMGEQAKRDALDAILADFERKSRY